MPLGMEVGVSPGYFVLDGDPALSPKNVCCGQTAARIMMPLGTEVGLVPCDIVLDGDPATRPPKGHSPAIFGPYLLRPNGCMDQDVTWYGGRRRPRRICVRWGPRSPSPKWGRSPPPKFSAHVYCGQTAGWMKLVPGTEVGLSPGDFVLDGDPVPYPKWAEAPIFGPRLLWPSGCVDQDAT